MISEQFPHCMQHYNDAVNVVMEISLRDAGHPHRHALFQVTFNREWNNNKIREYFQQVWINRRKSYTPFTPESSLTQAWIYENYQPAIDKISSLQVFLHQLV